ncbi:4-hydroxybenzoate 3-monooxygenase [Promicromonospora citrea]|uniref:4-hydroxybenzoate 3-monooxygenase n=1 Tax=Promicromonospora citrea TaxID=43677 RepID=UPI001E546309|nr:4-hydroxybenzoate 3-monooxygenase [Promicromonospora citrea]
MTAPTSAAPVPERTPVAVVGGGPAGLLLSHLLHTSGIEHVVLEARTREEIENTHRAGILEASSVQVLVDHGLDRVLREGDRHDGIVLRFDGADHRVDLTGLTGRSVWLYPQTAVFTDLATRRAADGGDVRWGATVTRVLDADGDRPGVLWTDAEGTGHELRCDVLVGADGSRSTLRHTLPEAQRRTYAHEYPYAWFGVIVEAPRSAPELVYTTSEHGFALISQRTDTHQRMYFQCDPDEDPEGWSEDRIWAELQRRVAGPDGFRLVEGPVRERSVLRFRSSVVEPVRHGRMLLAGDAAHTVPPTGAKGLNLALADVVVLHDVLETWFATRDDAVLDAYGHRVAERVWRAQHFSAWMSTMLHSHPGETGFAARRRLAELRTLVASEAGRRFLAEGYTGWGPVLGTGPGAMSAAMPGGEGR